MKLFKYALIALTTAQTVHLEDLGADDPFSYLDYYMDGDYYEDYQEELDYQIGARAKKKGPGRFDHWYFLGLFGNCFFIEIRTVPQRFTSVYFPSLFIWLLGL